MIRHLNSNSRHVAHDVVEAVAKMLPPSTGHTYGAEPDHACNCRTPLKYLPCQEEKTSCLQCYQQHQEVRVPRFLHMVMALLPPMCPSFVAEH